jgi:hypothetical protein
MQQSSAALCKGLTFYPYLLKEAGMAYRPDGVETVLLLVGTTQGKL